MKRVGIGLEIWQGDGTKRGRVWAMYNVKVGMKEYDGKTSIWISTVRGSGFKKYFDELYVLHNVGDFLTNWENISFSRRNRLHGVRSLVN